MKRKLIFKLKTGSHLYGLNRPSSDEDFLSVFIPTSYDLLGLHPINQIDNSSKSSSEDRRNTQDDIDDTSYSLSKFMHLVLQNNPNIIETLFATPENILVLEPEFKTIIDNYKKIVSTRVFHTFTGYAFSQKSKLMVKSERYHSLLQSTEELEQKYSVETLSDSTYGISEEEALHFNQTLKYYKGWKENCESFHKGMHLKIIYERLIEERDRYGWRVKTDTFETLGYDVKFGYHLIRILHEGLQLLETGRLLFPISGDVRTQILRVREGQVDYKELLEMYDVLDKKCKEAYEKTSLPKHPDFKWADKFLVETLKKSILEESSELLGTHGFLDEIY